MKDHLEWVVKNRKPWYKNPYCWVFYFMMIVAVGLSAFVGYYFGE